jgi:WhiB family redox-sensing transcriptional regulator
MTEPNTALLEWLLKQLAGPEWMDESGCAKVPDPDIFFPPRDKALYKVIASEAKAYCFGDEERPACPVRKDCLIYAISHDEQHGIWGGLSHRERNALVRKWRKQYKGSMTLEEFIFQYEKKGK